MARNIKPTKKILPPPNNKKMQVDDFSVTQVSKLIKDANEIAVIPSPTSGLDGFCAGVGLYNMILSKGKTAHFVFAHEIPNKAKYLIAESEVETNVSQRELLVSIDYSGTVAAKAKYFTDNDVLTVSLGPVPKEFDLSKVSSKIRGFNFDLVFVLGAQNLTNLGDTYSNLKDELKEAKVVNIDTKNSNSRYGIVNLIDKNMESLSHLIFSKSILWNLKPNKKAAKALLTGISNS